MMRQMKKKEKKVEETILQHGKRKAPVCEQLRGGAGSYEGQRKQLTKRHMYEPLPGCYHAYAARTGRRAGGKVGRGGGGLEMGGN